MQDPHPLGLRLVLCSTQCVRSIGAPGVLWFADKCWLLGNGNEVAAPRSWALALLTLGPSGAVFRRMALQLHLSCCKRKAFSGSDPFAHMRKLCVQPQWH